MERCNSALRPFFVAERSEGCMYDSRIEEAFDRNLACGAFGRAFECLEILYRENKTRGLPLVVRYRAEATKAVKAKPNPVLMDLLKKAYLLTAKDRFDDYCIYLEWDRAPQTRFYTPRRKQLLPIVEALQDLEDDNLDLLAISMPPGTGKTTIAIFYLTWIGGKYPNEPSICGSHSVSFVEGVYRELLRIISPGGEYLWSDVFPNVKVSRTNAQFYRIDLDRTKRFETYQMTSLNANNSGKIRAKKLLYCDDLVSGIDVAMSKPALDKIWEQYTVDFLQRKIGACKELHIATRWSVHDPIGRLEREYEGDPRARFITFPAVDESGTSNFDYPFGLGFTTEAYQKLRDSMDDASWKALYMNEPIEREGLLYQRETLRRYFYLPEEAPDAILAVVDTKDRGTDYCAMPIVYQYGQDLYVEDILCDNSNPEIVEARLVALLKKHNVQIAQFESNGAGGRIAENCQKELRAQGYRTKIITKYTTANKETKIIVNSPTVKQRCLFKDDTLIRQDNDYKRALNFLCNYSMAGKNKNDDVPDAFAQLAEFVEGMGTTTVQVFRRPF